MMRYGRLCGVLCAINRMRTAHDSIELHGTFYFSCAMALRFMPRSPRRRIRLASVVGELAADQWLAEFTGLHRTSQGYLFSLRNGFTAYNVLSPENGSFASVAPRRLLPPGALTPAPRRQDHTPLPYASAALVNRSFRVHRIPVPRS